MTVLLERDRDLKAMTDAWEAAGSGVGSMAMVTGESGAGKTTLMREVVASAPRHAVLWGACDPLATPRPLGPLHDFADGVGDVRRLLDDGALPHEVFVALFEELRASPHLLVVDDLQWADEATIDLLRFLVRRIEATRSLVVGTYREEEIGPTHPLRALLGDLARTDATHHIALAPLSLDAVARMMAGSSADPAEVHRLTGGNPFYVSQIADHPLIGGLPATVRDAVLARTANLDARSRETLELLACTPEAIPDVALPGLAIDLPTLRRLDATGLVDRRRRGLTFRHELCRLAIIETLPPGAEALLHARILDVLEMTSGADAAFMAHHAVGAADPERIWKHATAAGAAAARAGAHTESAAFYETALSHGSDQPPRRRAQIIVALAEQLYLIDRLPEAIARCGEARTLHESDRDAAGVGAVLNSLALYEWYNANRDAAEHHVADAVEVLEPTRDEGAAALANAYAIEAYLALHDCDLDRAKHLVGRAAGIAATVDDPRLAVWVDLVGSATAMAEQGAVERNSLVAVIEEGLRHGLDEIPSTGWSNLAYLDVEQRRFTQAEQVLSVSLPFTVERDIPICNTWQLGVRGRLNLLKGRWSAAVEDAGDVLGRDAAHLSRTWPHLVRGLVALRRGEPGASKDLDLAWELANRFGEPLRVLPAAAALVEQVWLSGEPDARVAGFPELLADTARLGAVEWSMGDLGVWLRRVGLGGPTPTERLPEPYRRYLSGDLMGAATAWAEIGCRYEQALALVESGVDEASAGGIETLDLLGADAVAAKFRQDLRRRGATGVPARPRATTRANPAGLTRRQLDVLRLVAAGLTNADLADRLFISRKTADHHVSAILMKLDARSRTEAAAVARRLGIVD